MNSFELNKILGAVLGTCLILLALNIGAGALFAPEKPAKPGFDIAVKESRPSVINCQAKKEFWLRDQFPPGSIGKVEPGCMSYYH